MTPLIDLNQVSITYSNLLCEKGLHINEVNDKYKKQLQVLIQESIPSVKFVRSKYSNQLAQSFAESPKAPYQFKSYKEGYLVY